MTQRIARALAGLALVVTAATTVAGCGKYGPPEPYPPGHQRPDGDQGDEDEQGQQP